MSVSAIILAAVVVGGTGIVIGIILWDLRHRKGKTSI